MQQTDDNLSHHSCKTTTSLRTSYSYHPTRPVQFPPSKRVFDPSLQDPIKQRHNNKPVETWSTMMSRTANEESICGTQQRISHSNNFKSEIFTPYLNTEPQKRISKPTEHTNYSTTSQIVGLPGCVKRGMYDIKDDKKFNVKNNIGHMYKMQRDYNCHLSYDMPNSKTIPNCSEFPIKQRFGNSYRKGGDTKANIFNIDCDNSKEIRNKGKKTFYNTHKDFLSQIVFA